MLKISNVRKRVLVPRWMDANNFNPQNSNAQNILSRLSGNELHAIAFHYNPPRVDIATNPSIDLCKLWRRRFWKISAWLAYQKKFGAIFYPGGDISDDLGWRFRDFTGRRIPIIATLEGLAGNPVREKEYSNWADHQVNCQHVDEKILAKLDRLYQRADHVIAISPFLAAMGRRRYGDKFSTISLGIDSSVFFSDVTEKNERVTVIGAGRLYANKRPDLFIELASRFPTADFTWYGWGEMLDFLRSEAKRLGLSNIDFPGSVSPADLANAMRKAHIFVLPSKSEGVPKVTQEAAACGLAQVIFGYYEAPSVVNATNGFAVWDDDSFFARVGDLIDSPNLVSTLGQAGAEMARAWDWGVVVPKWREQLMQVANQR
jgi:glycosyltransferase involved in cell wall biosynthesis